MDRYAPDPPLQLQQTTSVDQDEIFDLELNDSLPIGGPGRAPSQRKAFASFDPILSDSDADNSSRRGRRLSRDYNDENENDVSDQSDFGSDASSASSATLGSPAHSSSLLSDQPRHRSLRDRRASVRLSRSLDDSHSSEEEIVGSPGKAPAKKARRGSFGAFASAAIFLGVCFGTIGLAKIAKDGPSSLPDFDKCEGGVCIPGANF